MASDRPRRYLGLHYFILRVLGVGWWHHPDEGDTRNFPDMYLYYSIITNLVWVVTFVGLETIDPFIGEKDLDNFMLSLSFVITHDLSFIKLYIFIFKNVEMQDIVHTLEVKLQDYHQNYDKTRKTIRITNLLAGFFVFFGWGTILNGMVYGAIEDMKWKAEVALMNDTSAIPMRMLPQPIYIPWNYQDDIPYITTLLLETVGLLWTSAMVMTMDTIIASVILHMSTQFSVIQEAIATVYDRTIMRLYKAVSEDLVEDVIINEKDKLDKYEMVVMGKYRKEEIDKALESSLKSCFRQHQLLIGCVEKFGRTYSYGFMTQLLSSSAAICVIMVQVSQDASSFKSLKLVTSLSFFVAMTTQLGIQCYTGNELTLQASRVCDAVMQSNWERMPSRLRLPLILMMLRAQRPLRLSAAGFANLDNACFLSIMKAAYSYYAVLSQKEDSV